MFSYYIIISNLVKFVDGAWGGGIVASNLKRNFR